MDFLDGIATVFMPYSGLAKKAFLAFFLACPFA